MKNEGEPVKRIVCALLILCLLPVCSCAEESFFDLFNDIAPGFNVQQLNDLGLTEGSRYYASGFTYILQSDEMTSVIGSTPIEVITVACCVLRAIEGTGNAVDQYGCVMQAYFSAQAKLEDNSRVSQTKTGISVVASTENGYVTIGLVK